MGLLEALCALGSATGTTINYVGTAKAAVNVAMDVFTVTKTVAGAIAETKYARGREDDCNPKTGELPYMVNFMEETHKQKSAEIFVYKKAEEIARRCRELMKQEKVTHMTQADDSRGDYSPIRAEKDDIFSSMLQAKIRKEGRFAVAVGSILLYGEIGQSSSSQSYEEKYLQTQRELTEAKLKIQELERKYEDVAYWNQIMTQLHPNLIPPSQRNQTRTENVSVKTDHITFDL